MSTMLIMYTDLGAIMNCVIALYTEDLTVILESSLVFLVIRRLMNRSPLFVTKSNRRMCKGTIIGICAILCTFCYV